MCVEHQKIFSKKQCKKSGNCLQLLRSAMLEVYRVVYFTVFSASGRQHKSAQTCTHVRVYVCTHACMYVCMYVRMYVGVYV